MALAYLGDVVYAGGPSTPAPGPAITYNGMAAGSAMVIMGVVTALNPGTLSTSSMVTSITDTAGNAWSYSTADTQALTDGTPPAAYQPSIINGAACFIAWSIGGLNPGTIQLEDATGNADYWYLAAIEVAGVLAPNLGRAAAASGTHPSLGTPVANYGDLTCGVLMASSGITVQPPGMTNIPSGVTQVSLNYDVTGASMGSATWTLSSSYPYAAAMMSFNAVPEYPPVPPLPGMISS